MMSTADVQQLTQALELVRQHLEALPPAHQQLMRRAVAGYVLGADADARSIAQALAALEDDV